MTHSPTPENLPLDLHRSPQPSDAQQIDALSVTSLNQSNESHDTSRDTKKSSIELTPVKNRRKRKPNVTKKVSATEASFSENDTDLNNDIETDLKTSVIACEQSLKNAESDDCETIDKIALMVSNITSNSDQTLPVTESENQLQKSSDELIESQLQQMFADPKDVDEPMTEPAVGPDSTVAAIQDEMPKEIKKKKTQAKPRKKKVDGAGQGRKKQASVAPVKLKNGKPVKKKNKSIDNIEGSKVENKTKPKENGGKSRMKPDVAPFVQIQKDGSFAIVNQTVNGDDDTEKSVNKSKKGISIDKHKAIRGLHVSTLSNKYDADKRDMSWICVFCKLGPHKHKLGDLFGPYIISKTSEEFSQCLQDPATDIFRQKNKNKLSKVPPTPPTPEKSKKKRKLNDSKNAPVVNGSVSTDELFNGMSKIDENNFEVWFHEDCIVWANGVYIIGTKIIGMEAAIWNSTRYRCAYCLKNGAMLSCLSRDCNKTAHVWCARNGWKLDEEFKTFCELHH